MYNAIARIAAVRGREPALRYGRQYFREISGNGIDFGHPIDGRCTLAYSRILDETEIVVAMNLDNSPRNDFVTVDAHLRPVGQQMVNLLDPEERVMVEGRGSRHAVRVALNSHAIAILRRSEFPNG